jgi:hypothetical protein
VSFWFGFAEGAVVRKRTHEIRDPIHTFIRIDSDEREVLDSPPLQRLRHIHQLAMSHLVYPSATHKRFEHSLGVMELAGRVFDVITKKAEDGDESVREMVRDAGDLNYWRRTLRMAALCHDVGHLPFSHAAERDLFPDDWNHERVTVKIIRAPMMEALWNSLTPPRPDSIQIAKLAVGPEKCAGFVKNGELPDVANSFTDWETILSEVIIGDVFGVDRMDYLLRDSYHAGVAYGRFDHYRLVDTLRILPRRLEGSQELALGIEEGGLHSAEALLLARYFMYTQVYFHPVPRIYEVHLRDFLSEWLQEQRENGRFPTEVGEHLAITDNEVMAAILKAASAGTSRGRDAARRIIEREHFHLIYKRNPVDSEVNPSASDAIYAAACAKFGNANIRRDARPAKAKSEGVDFPVLTQDERVVSSLALSDALPHLPIAAFDYIFIDDGLTEQAKAWLEQHRAEIIKPTNLEEDDGQTAA